MMRGNFFACAALGLVVAGCSSPAGGDDGEFVGVYTATAYNGAALPGMISQTPDGSRRTMLTGGRLHDGSDIRLYFSIQERSPSGTMLEVDADTLLPMGPIDFRETGGVVEAVYLTPADDEIILSGRRSQSSRMELDLCGGCGAQVVEFRRR